jgi:glucosyl-3-phosphoglycerate synthase
MADFHMNRVPTFPRLAGSRTDLLEKRLIAATRSRPAGIVIPALFTDLAGPAMANILEELRRMRFIKRVYLSLNQADASQHRQAMEIVAPLGSKAVLLWNDAPQVQEVVGRIEQALPLGRHGKGRPVWIALGYVIAGRGVSVVAFHDADVLTFDREFVVRLLYLVARQRYQFAKGYYARHAERLYGRVVRLFYFPFVRALKDILGPNPFLDYMADFRYPLSGEFATFVSIAREMRFPCDWGIEVGVLGEVYRLVRVPRICQVELVGRYDHKHQALGPSERQGLLGMASDIARTFFTHLVGQGQVLSDELFQTLRLTYVARAREFVDAYENLSEMHGGLTFDLHEEVSAIEGFARAIEDAVKDFRAYPFGSPLIPTWRRVEVAMEGVADSLKAAFDSAMA